MIDFGLSNMYKPGEKLATACGSPCYAAPELIKGLEYVGVKADLWSAGVVLFTMVCGHLPFEDSNTQSLYQKILNARYKFTCYLSQEIQSLVSNILVPDPELRYGLKQVMSNTWYKKTY
jgi:serine/threonine protein kinase